MINKKLYFPFLSFLLFTMICFAENPLIQTNYTPDAAPMVYNDTVFLYTGHDEDNATGFIMYNYLLYTSTDLVNWTDHGVIASPKVSAGRPPMVHGLHNVFPEMESFITIAPCTVKELVYWFPIARTGRSQILLGNRCLLMAGMILTLPC